MKIRGNVILQYSVTMLVILALVSSALGITLARGITAYQLRSHIRLYPAIVGLAVKDNTAIFALFAPSSGAAPTAADIRLFRSFLQIGSVFRVKVWSRDATIVWSDQPDLIGQRFPDNDGFQAAMRGTESYEIAALEKAENIDEKNRGITLEIYTPVIEGGKTIGVIELYEANRDLFAQIARSTRFSWLLVLGAGIVLYVSLFAIFYQSYRRQQRTSRQLIETQDVTIFALAYQAELRDQQTGKHLERTAVYVRLIAEKLAMLPQFHGYLTPHYIEDLVKSAPLHDIGKVGVPDSILLKPAGLTAPEMDEVKKHCEYGARVLRRAEQKLEFQSFLSIAIQLTLYHHEKWDGSGYPHGLLGDQIPISARIMALADNYDALRTARPYKRAFPHSQCVDIIRDGRGKHFDPAVVDAFLFHESDFERVSIELAD